MVVPENLLQATQIGNNAPTRYVTRQIDHPPVVCLFRLVCRVHPNPTTDGGLYLFMRALDPEAKAIVWQAFEPLIPPPVDHHPLGRYRHRKSNYDCFEVMVVRLVTGCSFEDAERLCENKVSDTTVRSTRDEWVAAGIYY